MNKAFSVLNVSNIYSDKMHGRIGIYSQKNKPIDIIQPKLNKFTVKE